MVKNLLKDKPFGYDKLSDTERGYFDKFIEELLSKEPEWIAEHQLSYDQRNTDNAWVVTDVINYHDSTGDVFGNVEFDVAQKVATWRVCHRFLKPHLFASHGCFIEEVTKVHGAAW